MHHSMPPLNSSPISFNEIVRNESNVSSSNFAGVNAVDDSLLKLMNNNNRGNQLGGNKASMNIFAKKLNDQQVPHDKPQRPKKRNLFLSENVWFEEEDSGIPEEHLNSNQLLNSNNSMQ